MIKNEKPLFVIKAKNGDCWFAWNGEDYFVSDSFWDVPFSPKKMQKK